MSEGHEAVRDLLGAWALRAVPPGEERLVRAHLADCGPCTTEAALLRSAVGALDGPPVARRDPAAGRARGAVLSAALRRRDAAPGVAAHAAPYAAAVAGLDALLREAEDDGAWGTPVVHDWDVHATVAHLVAADEPFAQRLGLLPRMPVTAVPPGTPWRETWDARTAAVIAQEHRRDPAETWHTWRERTRALLASPSAYSEELAAREVEVMGLPLPVAEHFLVRAFETWLHTDDIGRAVGRAVPPPPDAHLNRLVGLGMRILGLGSGPDTPPVRLTVTGPGPGHECLLGSDAGPVVAELALDPVDFCLLIGGRYAPRDIPRTVTGDEDAARSVLERATSLAWL